jgi:hypothetical protein
MKKNISFGMLLRAIRYCSSFQSYIDEHESLCIALLLNRYPSQFISEKFDRVLLNLPRLMLLQMVHTVSVIDCIYERTTNRKGKTSYWRLLSTNYRKIIREDVSGLTQNITQLF